MSIETHLAESMKRHQAKHGKKKLKSVEIEKGADSGYIVSHRMDNSDGPYEEHKKYPIKSHAELMKHLKEHLGSEAVGGENA